MPNPHHTPFKERKAVKGTPRPGKAARGGVSKPGAITERTANWPKPTPTWGTSFNVTVKAPVVKTRSAKHGVD